MSKITHALTVLALPLVCALSTQARDDEKVDKNLGDEKKPVVAEVKKDEKKGGNWFTNFWTHRVGDTIGHGLKTGARKIDHAFTGGSKEQDEAEKRAKEVPAVAPDKKRESK